MRLNGIGKQIITRLEKWFIKTWVLVAFLRGTISADAVILTWITLDKWVKYEW